MFRSVGGSLRRVPGVVWIACALLAVALQWLATHRPDDVAARIGPSPEQPVIVRSGTPSCQPFAALPTDGVGVRYQLVTHHDKPPTRITLTGPKGFRAQLAPITVKGLLVTAPLPAQAHRVPVVGQWKLCIRGARPYSGLRGLGQSPAVDLTGKHYTSWLSFLPKLAERVAIGKSSFLGTMVLPLALLLLLTALGLSVRVLVRRLTERDVSRRTIAALGATAFCVAAAFALTTPEGQTPDEPAHQQYIEYLRRTQALPSNPFGQGLTPDVSAVMGGTKFGAVAGNGAGRPPWTEEEANFLDALIDQNAKKPAVDVWTTATSQPPGYYASAAAVDTVLGGNILDRILWNRLLSALFMGFAVAGGVLFARAAVPTAGRSIIVGGVIAAWFPIAAFMGGAVNPDAILTASAAWLFAGVAVALRHGLTWRRALWIGTAAGIGLTTKLTFLAFMPGLLVAGCWLLARTLRARQWALAGKSALAAVLPVALIGLPFYAWAELSGRGLVSGGAAASTPARPFSIYEWVTYAIELYIGRFGPIDDRIGSSGPDNLIVGFTGALGWLDYVPLWGWLAEFKAYWVTLTIIALLAVGRSVLRRRGALAEFALWAVFVGGLLMMIAGAGLGARLSGQPGFEQSRYLLPLIPIGIAGVGLALRTTPRWLRPPVGITMAMLGIVHGAVLYFWTLQRYFA